MPEILTENLIEKSSLGHKFFIYGTGPKINVYTHTHSHTGLHKVPPLRWWDNSIFLHYCYTCCHNKCQLIEYVICHWKRVCTYISTKQHQYYQQDLCYICWAYKLHAYICMSVSFSRCTCVGVCLSDHFNTISINSISLAFVCHQRCYTCHASQFIVWFLLRLTMACRLTRLPLSLLPAIVTFKQKSILIQFILYSVRSAHYTTSLFIGLLLLSPCHRAYNFINYLNLVITKRDIFI